MSGRHVATDAGTATWFAVVPASYVFLLRNSESGRGTEVLLQLRGEVPYMAGHWAAAAAGHVERGETAFDAVRREAEEELGITDPELSFVTSMQRTEKNGGPIDERIDFFFTAHTWQGEPHIGEPRKALDLRWFLLDDLPVPMVPYEAEVLRMICEGRVEPYTTFGFAPIL
jgi:8-oxo-dGTP diphosphatase